MWEFLLLTSGQTRKVILKPTFGASEGFHITVEQCVSAETQGFEFANEMRIANDDNK